MHFLCIRFSPSQDCPALEGRIRGCQLPGRICYVGDRLLQLLEVWSLEPATWLWNLLSDLLTMCPRANYFTLCASVTSSVSGNYDSTQSMESRVEGMRRERHRLTCPSTLSFPLVSPATQSCSGRAGEQGVVCRQQWVQAQRVGRWGLLSRAWVKCGEFCGCLPRWLSVRGGAWGELFAVRPPCFRLHTALFFF